MKLPSVTVASSRSYVSSSGYWTWARCCAVSTGPRWFVGLLPFQRCMATRVAYVNTAFGGADVGLFGSSLTFTSSSVLQAPSPSTSPAPRPAIPKPLYRIVFLISRMRGALRNDADVETEAAGIRRHVDLDPLIVPAAVGELRVDVR